MKFNLKFLKTKISVFLSFLFFFQLILSNTNNSVFASTIPTTRITPSVSYTVTGETKVGNIIEIAVNVANASDLYGGSVDFLYDTSLLQVQSITKGNIFGTNEVLTPIGVNGKIEKGQASFAVTMKGNKDGVNSANGTIAIVKAKILKEGNLTFNSDNFKIKLSNSSGVALKFNLSDITLSFYNKSVITSFKSDKTSGQVTGTTIKFTATTNTDSLYTFFVKQNGVWSTVQDYSTNNTFSWTPSMPGEYTIRVRVKHINNTSNNSEDFKDIDFTILKPTTSKIVSFNSDKKSGQVAGTTIKFTATTNTDSLYTFFVKQNGVWSTVQNYSTNNTFSWTPSMPGEYTIRVRVKHINNTSNNSEDFKDIDFTILKPTTSKIVSFNSDKKSGQVAGTTIKFTATTNTDSLYTFFVKQNGVWSTVQNYSTNNTFSWTPSMPGEYTIRVRVKHINNTSNNSEDFKDINFTILKPTTSKIVSFNSDKKSGQVAGTTIKFTATTNTDSLYTFFVKQNGVWSTVQNYSTNNTFSWTPSMPGEYTIRVRVKHINNTSNNSEDFKDINFTILKPTTSKIVSFNSDKKSEQVAGTTIKFTATTNTDSLYTFFVKQNGVWSTVQNYSTNNTFSWTPSMPGEYTIRVRVKHINNTSNNSEDFKDINFTILKPTTSKIVSFNSDKKSGQVAGTTIKFTATTNTDSLYTFFVKQNGVWSTVQNYSTNNTFSWTPSMPGEYTIRVRVKHINNTSNNSEDFKDINFTILKPTTSKIVSFNSDKKSEQAAGTTIKFTATTNTDSLYTFFVKQNGVWSTVQNYSTNNTFSWTPSMPGEYTIRVRVKHINNTSNNSEDFKDINFTIL